MTPTWRSKPDTEREAPVTADVNNSYDFSEGWDKQDYNSHLFLSREQLPKVAGRVILE